MKQLFIFLLLMTLFTSCDVGILKTKHKFTAIIISSVGSYSEIYCDSIQMTSITQANVWVDGINLSIKTNGLIRIKTNESFKPTK